MIQNTLKQLWAAGNPTINGWCSIGNPFTAEIMAAQGYDSVTIDLQHGALDYSAALPMLQAMHASGAVLMTRVPWLEPGIIMKCLDAGAGRKLCRPRRLDAVPDAVPDQRPLRSRSCRQRSALK